MLLFAICESARSRWRARPGGGPAETIDLTVVTADDRFYSSLLYVTTQLNWRARWVRSMERGVETAKANPASIVILDVAMAPCAWAAAIRNFRAWCPENCVVAAIPALTDELWRMAIEAGAYDAVCRTLEARHFAATLCFASHWRDAINRSSSRHG